MARPTFSPKKTADKMAVIIGITNPIAVASPRGICVTPIKKETEPKASAKALIQCVLAWGIEKPALPSRMNRITASPTAPKKKRSAAIAVAGQSVVADLTRASPKGSRA